MSFVGCVVDPIDDERSVLTGACFCWGNAYTYVTTDHVVQASIERGARRLSVGGPGMAPRPVESVVRHPSRDVAVLTVEHPSDPFIGAAAPVVGQVCGSMAYAPGEEGMASLVTRVTAVGGSRTSVSTAASRGSEDGGPDVVYTHQLFAVHDALAKGFCGAPVIGADGCVLGIVVLNRTYRGATRGMAQRFDALVPWIDDVIEAGAATCH